MADPSERAKQKIDSMSKEELLHEKNKGNRSIYQNENFSYMMTRLEVLQGQEEGQHKQETLNVAKQANTIATKALGISNQSKNIAIWAIAISLITLVIQIFLSK
jgi:hypothetical protein